jgi:hypothetical protein
MEETATAWHDLPCALQVHWGRSRELIPSFVTNHTSGTGVYEGTKCDLVHIDGDHSFEGARADFENMYPMMHCDTVILMDDVFDDEESGPTKLWRDLKHQQVCAGVLLPTSQRRTLENTPLKVVAVLDRMYGKGRCARSPLGKQA